MGFSLGDDISYNRAKLHTQRTRYQTEEQKVAEDKESKVIVHDGTEDESEAKKKSKESKKKDKDENGKSEMSEAMGNRPADKEEGDKKSPKQGGSVEPEVGELCGAQDSKPSIKGRMIGIIIKTIGTHSKGHPSKKIIPNTIAKIIYLFISRPNKKSVKTIGVPSLENTEPKKLEAATKTIIKAEISKVFTRAS